MAAGLIPEGFGNGRHAIGIDVGGTKIAGALVNLDTGAIAARRQVRTELGSPWYVAAGYVHYGTPGWRLPR